MSGLSATPRRNKATKKAWLLVWLLFVIPIGVWGNVDGAVFWVKIYGKEFEHEPSSAKHTENVAIANVAIDIERFLTRNQAGSLMFRDGYLKVRSGILQLFTGTDWRTTKVAFDSEGFVALLAIKADVVRYADGFDKPNPLADISRPDLNRNRIVRSGDGGAPACDGGRYRGDIRPVCISSDPNAFYGGLIGTAGENKIVEDGERPGDRDTYLPPSKIDQIIGGLSHLPLGVQILIRALVIAPFLLLGGYSLTFLTHHKNPIYRFGGGIGCLGCFFGLLSLVSRAVHGDWLAVFYRLLS